jgi:threonine/homoserine/homoserine lactone efflux protein
MMFGIHDYWLFVLSALMLNIAPGQDTLYILGRSIGQGRRIGIASALGGVFVYLGVRLAMSER